MDTQNGQVTQTDATVENTASAQVGAQNASNATQTASASNVQAKAKAKLNVAAAKSAKAAKKAKKAKRQATAKALSLTLDFKSNHRIRQSAADKFKADLFALHAVKKGSRAYVALCSDNAGKVIAAHAGKEASHLLCVGAVGNKVTLGADGFYSRAHGKGALVGNVDALRKLYGSRVTLLTLAEMQGRFDGIKEQVTRKIGTGRDAREIVGRELLTDGDHFVMLSKMDNGKLAVFNGEFSTNAHNRNVRSVTVKTTVAK